MLPDIYDPQQLNRYAYVRNNPLKYIDPTGHAIDWSNWMFWGTDNNIWKGIADAGEQVWMGNWTEKVTVGGTILQVATGAIGLDLAGDIRDIAYDVANWEWTKEHMAQTALDSIAILPVVGAIKYADEAGSLIKGTGKNIDVIVDADLVKMHKSVSLGKGVTGRWIPKNLNEQLAMKEVLSNPLKDSKELTKFTMNDKRWSAKDGWVKMAKNVNGVEIHFVYNKKTKQFDDFKFKKKE
jgi:hypothetical protein